MRIVALEEHLTIPQLAARIGREAILARGMNPPGSPVPPAVARGDKLRDVGAGRHLGAGPLADGARGRTAARR